MDSVILSFGLLWAILRIVLRVADDSAVGNLF